MADTQTFSNIDGAKWARIQAAVKAKAGIDASGNVGAGGAKGIQISWNYDPTALTLEILLVKRSFYDPSEQAIDTDIAQWIASA